MVKQINVRVLLSIFSSFVTKQLSHWHNSPSIVRVVVNKKRAKEIRNSFSSFVLSKSKRWVRHIVQRTLFKHHKTKRPLPPTNLQRRMKILFFSSFCQFRHLPIRAWISNSSPVSNESTFHKQHYLFIQSRAALSLLPPHFCLSFSTKP